MPPGILLYLPVGEILWVISTSFYLVRSILVGDVLYIGPFVFYFGEYKFLPGACFWPLYYGTPLNLRWTGV